MKCDFSCFQYLPLVLDLSYCFKTHLRHISLLTIFLALVPLAIDTEMASYALELQWESFQKFLVST